MVCSRFALQAAGSRRRLRHARGADRRFAGRDRARSIPLVVVPTADRIVRVGARDACAPSRASHAKRGRRRARRRAARRVVDRVGRQRGRSRGSVSISSREPSACSRTWRPGPRSTCGSEPASVGASLTSLEPVRNSRCLSIRLVRGRAHGAVAGHPLRDPAADQGPLVHRGCGHRARAGHRRQRRRLHLRQRRPAARPPLRRPRPHRLDRQPRCARPQSRRVASRLHRHPRGRPLLLRPDDVHGRGRQRGGRRQGARAIRRRLRLRQHVSDDRSASGDGPRLQRDRRSPRRGADGDARQRDLEEPLRQRSVGDRPQHQGQQSRGHGDRRDGAGHEVPVQHRSLDSVVDAAAGA